MAKRKSIESTENKDNTNKETSIPHTLTEYLEKRRQQWIFHFIIQPKTSPIDKPEWYLESTLKWIDRDLVHLLEEYVRLTRDIKIIKEGLGKDKPHKKYYEKILIETYNEVICYIKSVKKLLGQDYPKDHDITEHFTGQIIFDKILDAEHQHNKKLLQEIFNINNLWEKVLDESYSDEYSIPVCVGKFLLIIKSLKDRVDCFEWLDAKYALIGLQISLADEFLDFLKHHSSKRSIFPSQIWSKNSKMDSMKEEAILCGTKFLKFVFDKSLMIPESVSDLPPDLVLEWKEIRSRYTKFYYSLVEEERDPFNICEKLKLMERYEKSSTKSPFVIVKQIGWGQFSKVYQARWHTRLNDDDTSSQLINTDSFIRGQEQNIEDGSVVINVALKHIKLFDIQDAKLRADCLREVDLLQKLKHPNIINYNKSFIERNDLYIVLELADGGDLCRLINYFSRRNRLIMERSILKYFTQICSAVEYIHSQRILHRDIKPANIFMTSKGVVKLGDFGLGRFFSNNTLNAHSIVGTFFYMAPERINRTGYEFSSDIWSLGCVLYELITLHSPFSKSNFEQNLNNNQRQQQCINLSRLINLINTADYPSLDVYKNVSPTLKDLTNHCLKLKPEDRPNIVYICDVVRSLYQMNENNVV